MPTPVMTTLLFNRGFLHMKSEKPKNRSLMVRREVFWLLEFLML